MPIELNAPITAVTVYTDRARVTRSSEIELSAGESVLVLSGLPEQMERESVRVSGKGAGITIRGVDVKRDVQTSSDTEASLHNQYKQLMREALVFDHEMRSLDEQLAYYRALKTQASTESGSALLKQETDFERVTQIANYIRDEIQSVYEQQRELLAQKEVLEEELDTLKVRMSDDNKTNIQVGQAVHIAVDAEQEMTFTYEVDYLVTDARWKPLYDVRLLNDNEVELTYMAQVTQETNEDWDNVNLTLSTARPAISNQLPEASAWYVSDRAPYRPQASRARDVLLGDLIDDAAFYEDSDDSSSNLKTFASGFVSTPEQEKATVQQAVVESSSSGAVMSYNIGTPITIVGNGEAHKTTITITGLKADLSYITVPRIAQQAYLKANITNTSDYTLLPGEASIFHEDDFVGKTTLETISPSEDFEIQLGVDERIKVERELLMRDTSKNMIGNKQQITYRYAVHVTNLTQQPTKIRVQDQYPLSHTVEIKIKLKNTSPPPDEENDLHILTWELDLPDGEQRSIELTFTVECDRYQSVYGLAD